MSIAKGNYKRINKQNGIIYQQMHHGFTSFNDTESKLNKLTQVPKTFYSQ